MNKGRELTVENLYNLKDGDEIYIEYLDNNEWKIDYCNENLTHNTICKFEYNTTYIIDDKNNSWTLKELIEHIDNGRIKVYKWINKYTNYERIKNMTIEEMAEMLIKYDTNDYWFIADGVEIKGMKNAIKKEIEWLKKEVE